MIRIAAAALLLPVSAQPASAQPVARACHAAAAVHDGMIVWGGARACGVDVLSDSVLWQWNGGEWRMLERLPLVPREDALLVEAPVSNDTARLMLLGGRRQGTVFGDVWQRSNGAWSQVVAEGGQGPLEHAAAAYDPVRERIVVFGGASGRTLSDRIWEFDGTRWHAIDARGPAPRVGHGMVWSRQDGGILMYGGFGEDRFRDLWKWDGVRWQRLAGDGPTFTEGHVVAAADAGIFVVGPGLGDEPGVRVWQWRDGRFMQVGPSGPPLRVGATAVYDRSRRVLVLWGGSDADGRPDPTVHEFDGAAWRTMSQGDEGRAGR